MNEQCDKVLNSEKTKFNQRVLPPSLYLRKQFLFQIHKHSKYIIIVRIQCMGQIITATVQRKGANDNVEGSIDFNIHEND